jgi:Bifunctional DNA primase/polymerase, N-terminal/Primase C terminal 2 (PriCT-2)
MKMLDAALSYVRRGWQVFPVPPGTKMGYSIEQRGFDNGKPWGSGIWDLEYDTPEAHGVDGAASLAKLEQVHGWLPPTLMFVSPSGSVHRLYRHPGGDFRIRSGALGAEFPGIDVKGDGGMSIAPPSKTKKGKYKFINRFCIAAAPPWLLDMVVGPVRAAHERSVWDHFAREAKQAGIAELTLAMAMIPNDLTTSRDRWVSVGLALWSATGGSEEGYELFLAWSRRWPGGCNEEKTRMFWDTIKEAPHSITAGSIFHWAEEAVPGYMGRIVAREPDVIALLEEFWKLLGEP